MVVKLSKTSVIEVTGTFEFISLNVFDRWGQKVFETKDPNVGWDGNYTDQSQPLGSYLYLFERKDLAGKKVNKSVNVLLLR